MEKKSTISQLGAYVRGVLDTNKDGIVNIKDIFNLFPNQAIAIAVLFVDLVVAVAEYRVWDFGYTLTGDPYKAVGFVLLSAVPFYLGQVFWLYPSANGIQKAIAVVMVGGALYTSWIFGTADLTLEYEASSIFQMVTDLTAAYIISTLAYILFDDGIKAHRLKVQARAAAAREKEYQEITREVLAELRETLELQRKTESEFDSDAVEAQLSRLRGKNSTLAKVVGKSPNAPIPAMTANAATVTDHIPEVNPTQAADNSK